MEQFIRRYAHRRGIRLLVTFVRADFGGSTIKALRNKGWRCNGQTEPGQAGNRPDKVICDHSKWRFLCEVPTARKCEQTTFERWSA